MFPYICSMKEKFDEILKITSQLFQKYGIKSITMDDVAQKNGISKKTLYQYVGNKTELVKAVLQFEFKERGEHFQTLKETDLTAVEKNIEFMKLVVKMMKEHNCATEFDLMKYYPALHKEMTSFKMQNIYNMVVDNILLGKKQGLYRTEIDEKLIAKMHVIMDLSRVDNDFISFNELTSEHAIKEMFSYHLYAICNDKGLKILKEQLKEI